LLGPLYYRRWFSLEPINDSFVDLIVRGVLAHLRRDHPEPGEQGVRVWRPWTLPAPGSREVGGEGGGDD
jgi:hypothetical protein